MDVIDLQQIGPQSDLIPSKRQYHGAVSFNGSLFVFGGKSKNEFRFSQQEEESDFIWRFDVENEVWEPTGLVFPSIILFQYTLCDNLLCCYGGKEGTYTQLNDIRVFDLEAMTQLTVDVGFLEIPRRSDPVGFWKGLRFTCCSGRDDFNNHNSKQFELSLAVLPWRKDLHHTQPMFVKRQVMQLLLMWNHDQYEDDECNGFEWNMLPLEIVERIVGFLALMHD
eukprot:TRINITY_DN9938_c0_g2_i1.p2 TRINITY_DN9938_c0_g2~~TRINITY_DN9938_c0_g2_i1.p2  ORF type:complete len:223 (-),score=70.61 TRINITY_DN9938_c0_g2_i1:132-800(-)